VRTPTYADQSLRVNLGALPGPQGLTELITFYGDRSFRPESLLAYELGYRFQLTRRFSADFATFYNRYRHLQIAEQEDPFFAADPAPHLVIPLRPRNDLHGDTYGGEASSNWNVNAHWRLISGYSFLRLALRPDPTSHASEASLASRESPRHQFQVRSNLDLSRRLQFDAGAYYTAALASQVAAYTRLDARLGYKLRPDLEISVAGRNLEGGRHQELILTGPYPPAPVVGRSFLVKLTWEL